MTVIHGDCIEEMAKMPDASVDAIVTDPPYGLGFMGKQWDDLPPGDEFAAQALRVLKPGGHLLAFGGTRTYHRLTCAIEDAGFEIRDSVMWIYGSGFPKSHNLTGDKEGWGTALKPGHEPIVVARKRFLGTVAENVAEHGTAALNIAGCRIEGGEREMRGGGGLFGSQEPAEGTDEGRWPGNVILDEDAADELDAQTGILTSGSGPLHRSADKFGPNTYGDFKGTDEVLRPGDSGGASRFFYCAKTSRAERNAGLGDFEQRRTHRYSEKGQGPLLQQTPSIGVVEGNVHPTVKPINLMRWLVRLVTPPDGTILDPFLGSGTTGCAAVLEGFDFIGIEREAEYVAIAEARIAHWAAQPVQLELMG